MKKAHIILLSLFVAITISCNETYDDFDGNRNTTAGFTLGATLEIPVSADNPLIDFPISFFVSDVAPMDRELRIIVVTEETEVAPENYSFDSSVIIPANERRGSLLFSAMNVSLTEEFAALVLAFEESSEVTSGKKANIALRSND
ncbi:hypothetical protein POV27_16130 [Aureisphaera galaxeae]|uniref:hypothetical protein n=1 Tax=Aureisphaera galaxeae TaxID=1538023 RepID=UPI00235077E7|nr:hypothetical protein [Aureisphaera galaxeae]MDC8005588.1 hypothetical protein [Aureisphaera galaxeae]